MDIVLSMGCLSFSDESSDRVSKVLHLSSGRKLERLQQGAMMMVKGNYHDDQCSHLCSRSFFTYRRCSRRTEIEGDARKSLVK